MPTSIPTPNITSSSHHKIIQASAHMAAMVTAYEQGDQRIVLAKLEAPGCGI